MNDIINIKEKFKVDDSHSKIRGFVCAYDEEGRLVFSKENMIVESGRRFILNNGINENSLKYVQLGTNGTPASPDDTIASLNEKATDSIVKTNDDYRLAFSKENFENLNITSESKYKFVGNNSFTIFLDGVVNGIDNVTLEPDGYIVAAVGKALVDGKNVGDIITYNNIPGWIITDTDNYKAKHLIGNATEVSLNDITSFTTASTVTTTGDTPTTYTWKGTGDTATFNDGETDLANGTIVSYNGISGWKFDSSSKKLIAPTSKFKWIKDIFNNGETALTNDSVVSYNGVDGYIWNGTNKTLTKTITIDSSKFKLEPKKIIEDREYTWDSTKKEFISDTFSLSDNSFIAYSNDGENWDHDNNYILKKESAGEIILKEVVTNISENPAITRTYNSLVYTYNNTSQKFLNVESGPFTTSNTVSTTIGGITTTYTWTGTTFNDGETDLANGTIVSYNGVDGYVWNGTDKKLVKELPSHRIINNSLFKEITPTASSKVKLIYKYNPLINSFEAIINEENYFSYLIDNKELLIRCLICFNDKSSITAKSLGIIVEDYPLNEDGTYNKSAAKVPTLFSRVTFPTYYKSNHQRLTFKYYIYF